jgi:hypothetical protein
LPNAIIRTLFINGTTIFAGTGAGVFRASLPTSAASIPNIPQSPINLTLYPNPFSDQTTLEYVLSAPQHVRIAIFSPLGQMLTMLTDKWQQTGCHNFTIDMSKFASGTYIARLYVGETTQAILLHQMR